MKYIFLVLIYCLITTSSSAVPQGSWPQSMRGQYLPTPDWVLIIPALRNDDGTITIWNKEGEWNRNWIVPRKTPSGIRTVAISGDSEDKRLITGGQIDNMSNASLLSMNEKYDAKAIAVVVTDSTGDLAVAAWSAGLDATWQEGIRTDNPRKLALSIIDDIFSGNSNQYEYWQPSNSVKIIAERLNPITMKMEYRLEGDREVLVAVKDSEELDVIAEFTEAPTILDVSLINDKTIEDIFFEMGINLK